MTGTVGIKANQWRFAICSRILYLQCLLWYVEPWAWDWHHKLWLS